MANRKYDDLAATQKRAYLLYWADFLSKNGFQVSMDKKGGLRAVCVSCSRVYQSRFAFARDHLQKCEGPGARGEKTNSSPPPRPGQKVELSWSGPDGPQRLLVEVIREVKSIDTTD